MKVLVACECSGVVREAFAKRGHDCYSCDLEPTDIPGQHFQCDVLTILNQGWDLMIAHPPCTYLSNVGIGWFNEARYGEKAKLRKTNRSLAMDFFLQLYSANIDRICVENPVGYPNSQFRKPDQIIQPYWFGHEESKRTCLWLKNLPVLTPTNIVVPRAKYICKDGRPLYFNDAMSPSKDRAKLRSKTFQGIADAMASQWG